VRTGVLLGLAITDIANYSTTRSSMHVRNVAYVLGAVVHHCAALALTRVMTAIDGSRVGPFLSAETMIEYTADPNVVSGRAGHLRCLYACDRVRLTMPRDRCPAGSLAAIRRSGVDSARA
jgi:hypothetical protein